MAKACRDERRIQRRHRASVRQFRAVAEALTAKCLDEVVDINHWQQERPLVRKQLLWMLGIQPLPQRTALNATVTGTLGRAGYTIEKVVFESLPGLLVTANFYVPDGPQGPAPCVLYLCGHGPHPAGAKVYLQSRYLWYPRNGFACLVVDPLEFGEVPGIHHGTYNLNFWHWLSLGYTPAGVEVWNAMRALDWLETRSEVDAKRIGVTGVSGGGAMTSFLAAIDDRVAVAAPSCSTYTIGSQVAQGLVAQQCDCVFFPNVFGLDFPVVSALIAPRPLLITSGRRDSIFPPKGYREAYRRAKRIYDLYADGDSDRIRAVDANVVHGDAPLFLNECYRWMQRWLKPEGNGKPAAELKQTVHLEKPEDLVCLREVPKHAANFSIHNSFIKVPDAVPPDCAAAWLERRADLLVRLRETVFRWLPRKPIPFCTRQIANRGLYAPVFADFSEFTFDTEPGAPVRVLYFQPKEPTPCMPLLVVVRGRDASASFPDIDDLLPLLKSTNVIVLYPRFSEATLRATEFAAIERSAAVMGRTVAGIQVWDTMRVLHWAIEDRGLEPESLHLFGRGEMGIVSLYAALLECRVDNVILSDPPPSHWQGPALLTVLRTADIPEAAAMLCPRQLTFLRKVTEGFGFARNVYALCEALPSFKTPPSLMEAVKTLNYDSQPLH